MSVIAAYLNEGVHIQALQEINLSVQEIQNKRHSICPGAISQSFTKRTSHGVITIIHPGVAPYARPLQQGALKALGDIFQCRDTLTLALPTLPPFHFSNVYSPGQTRFRVALARALQPNWVTSNTVFMGDFNHAQTDALDSLNPASPWKWPWLRDNLTTTDSRPLSPPPPYPKANVTHGSGYYHRLG